MKKFLILCILVSFKSGFCHQYERNDLINSNAIINEFVTYAGQHFSPFELHAMWSLLYQFAAKDFKSGIELMIGATSREPNFKSYRDFTQNDLPLITSTSDYQAHRKVFLNRELHPKALFANVANRVFNTDVKAIPFDPIELSERINLMANVSISTPKDFSPKTPIVVVNSLRVEPIWKYQFNQGQILGPNDLKALGASRADLFDHKYEPGLRSEVVFIPLANPHLTVGFLKIDEGVGENEFIDLVESFDFDHLYNKVEKGYLEVKFMLNSNSANMLMVSDDEKIDFNSNFILNRKFLKKADGKLVFKFAVTTILGTDGVETKPEVRFDTPPQPFDCIRNKCAMVLLYNKRTVLLFHNKLANINDLPRILG